MWMFLLPPYWSLLIGKLLRRLPQWRWVGRGEEIPHIDPILAQLSSQGEPEHELRPHRVGSAEDEPPPE